MLPPESSFDAFKTDLALAMLTLKQELQKDIKAASDGVLTEMRERLQRNADDRALYNHTLDSRLQHLEKIGSETREYTRAINGRVKRHETAIYGDEKDGSDGLIKANKTNTAWRNALVTAGGVVTFFAWMAWMVWGDSIRERGLINRPAGDYVEFVDARIKQWLPYAEKPTQPAPNLVPKNKDGSPNPN